jgi:hypothetical protein
LLAKKGERKSVPLVHNRLLEIVAAARKAPVTSATDAAVLLRGVAARSKEHRSRRFGRLRQALRDVGRDLDTHGARPGMSSELEACLDAARQIDAVNRAECERDLLRVIEWMAAPATRR